MSRMARLFGVTTAMTTPFTVDGELDEPALRDLTNFLIENHVDCLYPAGTTGEMLLCSDAQRRRLAEIVIEESRGRVPVFVHVGAQTAAQTIALARHAQAIGATGVGAVTPPYFVMNVAALENYYRTLCLALDDDFPVYAYSIAARSGNEIPTSVLRSVRQECPNLVGIKYSGSDLDLIQEYLTVNASDFSVIVGNDRYFLAALVLGCDGVVSGCSNPYPELFVKIYTDYRRGDLVAARHAQERANRAIAVMKAGADMSIFKKLLDSRGVPGGEVHEPLQQISDDEFDVIKHALDGELR